MKIFKCKKILLNFSNEEMPKADFDWKLPILIDDDFNVIAGNSLEDKLGDEVLVIVAHIEKVFYQAFFELEKAILVDGNPERIQCMKEELGAYIKSFFVMDEQIDLFDFTDYQCINEENYKYIETEFKPKHSMKGKKDEWPEDPMEAFRWEDEE